MTTPHEHQVEMQRANMAVANEWHRGRMWRARSYLCQGCGAPAKDYHHPSYRYEDGLCVVPLCKKCHVHTHKCGLTLPFLGVVPTGVGVVRIAIAGEVERQPNVTVAPPKEKKPSKLNALVAPETRRRLNTLKAELSHVSRRPTSHDQAVKLLLDHYYSTIDGGGSAEAHSQPTEHAATT